MIDISKIRVGDEVTVRAKVMSSHGANGVEVKFEGSSCHLLFPLGMIATHTPAPREFKPGDRVTWGTGLLAYEFIAARNNKAVLWNDEYQWQIHDVAHLRHADESE